MTTTPVAPTNSVSELKTKIERRQVQVAIIGLGYVGLPLALLYTEQKVRVTGFDIDQRKVTTLTQGGSYIVRILPGEIQQAGSANLHQAVAIRTNPRCKRRSLVSSGWKQSAMMLPCLTATAWPSWVAITSTLPVDSTSGDRMKTA